MSYCNCCKKEVVFQGNKRCPNCYSLWRHRDTVHIIEKHNLLAGSQKILHFAPSRCVQKYVLGNVDISYTAIDLNDPKVGTGYTGILHVCGDITKLDEIFVEGEFDGIICSHVLEHVKDDARAIAQLNWVLHQKGWAIIRVPISPSRLKSYENPSITSPTDRKKHFGQWNHVRKYGRDFRERLSSQFSIVEGTGYLCRKIMKGTQ